MATTETAPDPTLDSLQLFLDGIAKTPLLTATEEVRLAKRVERGDLDAKEHMVSANLRLVVSIAKRYRNQGLDVHGADPGGLDRPGARRGEVRLPQGLQVLDLRHMVDPPGHLSRDRRQVAHDPHPDPHQPDPPEARRRPAPAAERGRGQPLDRGDRRRGQRGHRHRRGRVPACAPRARRCRSTSRWAGARTTPPSWAT
ncbi:MAG: sigma-70 factor domain-containing protein [Thermoleophilaceae bacterium]